MSSLDNRAWMYKRRLANGERNPEFRAGVGKFIRFAFDHPEQVWDNKIRCPCKDCHNDNWEIAENVWTHLAIKGFMRDYYFWSQHGESFLRDSRSNDVQYYFGEGSNYEAAVPTYVDNPSQPQPEPEVNSFFTMLTDMGGPDFNPSVEPSNPDPHTKNLNDLMGSLKQPLYGGSSHSTLETVVRVVNIKSENNISERCTNQFLGLLKEVLPEDNTLPRNYYEVKKFTSKLGLPYEVIDCCENYCMIYWDIDVHRVECKICGAKRYKDRKVGGSSRAKNVPRKKMYYLPIIPRLQRLYQSARSATDMRWHARKESPEGVMNHPSDGEAWKHFDKVHEQFAADCRNVRLGLCTDGFSPHGQYGESYSSWPIVVTVYNFPPWICMKDQSMFLTIVCPGPKNPKHKIDVMLQPLIRDMNVLWYQGVPTWDASIQQHFVMRAALMWTISDFPAYAMLSGWSTAGRLACPYCMERTEAFRLHNGKKMSWFDNHRKFLDERHRYRAEQKEFYKDTHKRHVSPPSYRSGEEILHHIDSLGLMKITEIGAESENARISSARDCGWRKRSIFWDLPYWKTNLIRHNLDVMHIEKNFFDNIFYTLLGTPGKTKDNTNSRADLSLYCDRPHLAYDVTTGRYPKAVYQLEKPEIKSIARWVKDLKLPDGFASKLGRLVDRETNMFKTGWKSHDCHVFLQKLLPIATKQYFERSVWEALTGISMFFRDICAASVSIELMMRWETDIPVILCNLERIFPPSFFDSMEHLPVHLPHEALLGGPISGRWMYKFERYMGKLKRTAKNKAAIEGSIVEAYITKETSLFCSQYFAEDVITSARRVGHNDEGGYQGPVNKSIPEVFKSPGRTDGGEKRRYMDDRERNAAHLFILMNAVEVDPYVVEWGCRIRQHFIGITGEEIDRRMPTEFPPWFEQHLIDIGETNQYMHALAQGPRSLAYSYPMYFIGGYKFHTVNYETNRVTKNSGVCLKAAITGNGTLDWYGILEEILVVEFEGLPIKQIALFKCKWFDPRSRGTRINKKFNYVEVNPTVPYPTYDPFIFASQATQVAFVPYPVAPPSRSLAPWLVVCSMKPKLIIDIPLSAEPEQAADRPFQEEQMNAQSGNIAIDSIAIELNIPTGNYIYIDTDPEIMPNLEAQVENEEIGNNEDTGDEEEEDEDDEDSD